MKNTKVSRNALAQAIRQIDPSLSRSRMFRALGIKASFGHVRRYWQQTGDAKPWHLRTPEYQNRALAEAQALLQASGVYADPAQASDAMQIANS